MRYQLQEMKNSGFTYYEIIDTENNNKIMFSSINFLLVTTLLGEYRRGERKGVVKVKWNIINRKHINRNSVSSLLKKHWNISQDH